MRRLKGWKVSSDGAFWGGILVTLCTASLLTVIGLALSDKL